MASISNSKKAIRQKKTRVLFQTNELDHFSSSAILKSNLLTNLDKELLTLVLNHSNSDKFIMSRIVDLPKGRKAKMNKSLPEVSNKTSSGRKANNTSKKIKLNNSYSRSPRLSLVRNICVLTSRARAVNQDYKISRNFFKSLSELGFVPGVKKV